MIDVSVIIPVYNANKWIEDCMKSITQQTALKSDIKLEIVVYNDGSTDNSLALLRKWSEHFLQKYRVPFIITGSNNTKGVGAAKNGAVKKSSGEYLCFQDIDDIMLPDRINLQLMNAQCNKNAIIGSCVLRIPPDSTPRLVKWANTLDHSLLKVQIYTSNGPTLLMPTWFCHKSVYNKVGGFSEQGHGTPEDLIFFYSHLDNGGDLVRVSEKLLIYRFHENATTFSVSRNRIWQTQLERIEKYVLPNWDKFTVWNAGKAGRKVIRQLTPESRKKVVGFCDVDIKKIGRIIQLYCPIQRGNILSLPVIHFSEAKPPLLICVKLYLTNGEFERNLKSMNLIDGKDYVLFS